MYICALFPGLAFSLTHQAQQDRLSTHWIGSGLARKLLGFWFRVFHGPVMHPHGRESQQPLVCFAIRSRELNLPLCSALLRHICNGVPTAGLPSTKETWTYETVQKTPKRVLKHLSYKEKLREL